MGVGPTSNVHGTEAVENSRVSVDRRKGRGMFAETMTSTPTKTRSEEEREIERLHARPLIVWAVDTCETVAFGEKSDALVRALTTSDVLLARRDTMRERNVSAQAKAEALCKRLYHDVIDESMAEDMTQPDWLEPTVVAAWLGQAER